MKQSLPYSKAIHRGFTLVELLVVIAIVAALAALVFSVTTKAIQKARKTSCTNLMRNMEISLESYMMEQNRPPLPQVKDNWDTILGDPGGLYSTGPLVAILTGGEDLTWTETDGNTFDMNKLNPKRVAYLEMTEVSGKEAGIHDDGKLYDPWGRELMFAINSRIQLVDVNPASPGRQDYLLQTWKLAEWNEIKPGNQAYVMWSYGADGVKGKGENASFRGSDDVKSF